MKHGPFVCVPVACLAVAAAGCTAATTSATTDGGCASGDGSPAEAATTSNSPDAASSETGSSVDASGADAGSTDSNASADTAAETGADGGPSPLGYKMSNVPSPDFAGVGDLNITSSSCVIDTDALKVDCASPAADGGLPYTFVLAQQSDGSQVAVLAVHALMIGASAQALAQGSVPLVVVAQTTVNVQGSLVAQGGGVSSDGPNAGGARQTATGSGGGAGGGGAPAGGAGGGGGFCGAGGTGANPGDAGNLAPGGRTYGSPTNAPLIGGSAGGGPVTFTAGGPGGGAIQISAGTSILVGTNGVISVPGHGATDSAGGGGSGGAILLEAPMITIDGALAANGGAGDTPGGGAKGQSGTSTTQAAVGNGQWAGNGGAGTQVDGASGTADPGGNVYNIGGGGGGVGRIRLNTMSGAATMGSTAIITPATSTPCATQGTLGT